MKTNIISFGEVLYDVFPTHRKIGGAPLNVALRLASLGVNAQIISRIGNDEIGKELLEFIQANNVPTDTIQIDNSYPTGEVLVELDQKGSATYIIKYPVAWDKIAVNAEANNGVKNADVLVFGSLVCRDETSYQTLLSLLKIAKNKVFDVNLRVPFYTNDILMELMNQADFIKFNDDELFEICALYNSPFHSLDQNIHFIAEKTNTKQICVTKGSHGAVLYSNNQMYYNSGYKVKVADTVGSGDSFLAGLLYQLFTGNSHQNAIDFACALGALVAQNEGANPKITKEEIEKFMNLNLKNL
jgi:fructokinase